MMNPSKRQRRRIARAFTGHVDTAKITANRRIPGPDGKVYLPGEDVTAAARGWANLRTIVKRGWVSCEPEVDHRTIPVRGLQSQPQSGEPSGKDLSALRDLGARPTMRKIKKALSDAGIDYDDDMGKEDLLMIANSALAAEGGEEG